VVGHLQVPGIVRRGWSIGGLSRPVKSGIDYVAAN